MTFEEYINIESNIRADEQLTETVVSQDSGRTTIDMEEEEMKLRKQKPYTIEPNVYSLADDSYYSIFFPKSTIKWL